MSAENYNSNSVDSTLARIEANQGDLLRSMVKIEIALSEQNRRVLVLEMAENKRTGALMALGTACSFIGVLIGLAINYFKK